MEAGEGWDELSRFLSKGKPKVSQKAGSGEEKGLWAQTIWVQIPALPLTSYVALSKWLNLSEAWLPTLRNGHNTTPRRVTVCSRCDRQHNAAPRASIQRVLDAC